MIQKTFYLGVDHNNMLQAFAKLSPAMDTIKQKGLEGARALAPLIVLADQAGMAGEAAGNAYRKVFQAALDKDKIAKANAALKGQGITLDFTNGKGEFGGLDKLFAQLSKLRGLTTQTRQGVIKSIFGDDAETLQVVSLLIDKGAAGYAEVQGKMARQASLQERVNRQLGTLKNLWDAASGTFTNALVSFGEAIAPELKQLTLWINDASEAVGNWAKAHPQLAGWLMKITAVTAVVLTVLGGLTLTLAAVLGPMAVVRYGFAMLGINASSVLGALRLVGQAVLWLGRALLMNPIGLTITGIALAAYLIYRYWDPIRAFFSGLWQEVRAAFSGGIGGIATLILNWSPLGLFYNAFAAVLGWFGIELPGKFTEFGANLLGGLVHGITGAMGAVKAAITGAADSVVGWFKEKLGIHSPSRVFAELGGFTMAGLDRGLTTGQKAPLATVAEFTRQITAIGAGIALAAPVAAALPATPAARPSSLAAAPDEGGTLPTIATLSKHLGAGARTTPAESAAVAALLQRIAAASAGIGVAPSGPNNSATDRPGIRLDTRPPIARAGSAQPSAAAAGGNTYVFQIYAAPGMDEQQLARLVQRKIEEAESTTAARGRSRLADKD